MHYNSAIGSNWAINCNSYYLDQLKKVNKMSKIDLSNFTKAELTAKLYVIQKDFVLSTKDEANEYALAKTKQSFIYEADKEELVARHLLLFLLGNDNNLFSKTLE
jgi:hypothetical protein